MWLSFFRQKYKYEIVRKTIIIKEVIAETIISEEDKQHLTDLTNE